MHWTTTAILLIGGLAAAVGGAAGEGAGECLATGAVSIQDALHVYWGPSTTELWQESNDMAGLQRAPCLDADGREVAADALLVAAPAGISPPPP